MPGALSPITAFFMKYLLILPLLIPTIVFAEPQGIRYVSDILEIPLRTGSSTRHRITSMLRSGTPVEVLRTNSDSGYTQVRVGDSQGWLLSRHLMDAPAAREILAPIQSENATLKERVTTLDAANQDLETRHAELAQAHQQLGQELAQLRRTAGNSLTIDEHNRQLQQQVVTLERALQIAQQENQSLSDNSRQAWFLIGALVLVGGIAIGLLLPRLNFRQRDRWGEL